MHIGANSSRRHVVVVAIGFSQGLTALLCACLLGSCTAAKVMDPQVDLRVEGVSVAVYDPGPVRRDVVLSSSAVDEIGALLRAKQGKWLDTCLFFDQVDLPFIVITGTSFEITIHRGTVTVTIIHAVGPGDDTGQGKSVESPLTDAEYEQVTRAIAGSATTAPREGAH